MTQIHVILDDTPPSVSIVSPEEGLAFNGILALNGIALDESGLSDVSVMLGRGVRINMRYPPSSRALS